jgi:hypothetical protein
VRDCCQKCLPGAFLHYALRISSPHTHTIECGLTKFGNTALFYCISPTMASKKKSLGSWFPSASLIKNTSYKPDDKICICLFYQYVKPLWSDDRKITAISYIEQHAEKLNIGGRVRVGTEGLNATISSTPDNVREFTRKLGEFDDHFKTTDFKYMDNLPLDRAFKELKVLPVKELVYYGIHAEEELAEGGEHVNLGRWRTARVADSGLTHRKSGFDAHCLLFTCCRRQVCISSRMSTTKSSGKTTPWSSMFATPTSPTSADSARNSKSAAQSCWYRICARARTSRAGLNGRRQRRSCKVGTVVNAVVVCFVSALWTCLGIHLF